MYENVVRKVLGEDLVYLYEFLFFICGRQVYLGLRSSTPRQHNPHVLRKKGLL